ncbi:unnamed protein product [Urochloa humidicola]
MPQVLVVAQNFMDMVAALLASKLDMLYDSAFICDYLSLQVAPTTGEEVCTADVVRVGTGDLCREEWVLDEYAVKHRVTIDKLLQHRVFVEVRDRRKDVSYKLMNQKFQAMVVSAIQHYCKSRFKSSDYPVPC